MTNQTKTAQAPPKPQPKIYRKKANGRPVAYKYVQQNGRYIPVRVEAS